MQQFSARAPDDLITLGMDMAELVPDGATLTGCAVSASVWAPSREPDPEPSAILQGVAGVADGTFIRQQVQGGVVGCVYVLSFTAQFSDGTSVTEDALQRVAAFVPEA